jgi:thiol-disulfide isomerase/thioredoxin
LVTAPITREKSYNCEHSADSRSHGNPFAYLGKSLPTWKFSQWNTAKALSVESLKGKPALVEIFRTGCKHCADSMPMIVDISKRYVRVASKSWGIQSPGAFSDASNPENDWKAVKTWLTERGVKHPVGLR